MLLPLLLQLLTKSKHAPVNLTLRVSYSKIASYVKKIGRKNRKFERELQSPKNTVGAHRQRRSLYKSLLVRRQHFYKHAQTQCRYSVKAARGAHRGRERCELPSAGQDWRSFRLRQACSLQEERSRQHWRRLAHDSRCGTAFLRNVGTELGSGGPRIFGYPT